MSGCHTWCDGERGKLTKATSQNEGKNQIYDERLPKEKQVRQTTRNGTVEARFRVGYHLHVGSAGLEYAGVVLEPTLVARQRESRAAEVVVCGVRW